MFYNKLQVLMYRPCYIILSGPEL